MLWATIGVVNGFNILKFCFLVMWVDVRVVQFVSMQPTRVQCLRRPQAGTGAPEAEFTVGWEVSSVGYCALVTSEPSLQLH